MLFLEEPQFLVLPCISDGREWGLHTSIVVGSSPIKVANFYSSHFKPYQMKNSISNIAFAILLMEFVDNKDISNSSMVKNFVEQYHDEDSDATAFDKREHEITAEIADFSAAFMANSRLKRSDSVARLFNYLIDKGPKQHPMMQQEGPEIVHRGGEY